MLSCKESASTPSGYEKKLAAYAANNPRCVQHIKLIGNWDAEMEMEADTEDSFYEDLKELRSTFSDILKKDQVLRIVKQHRYNFYPF